MAGSWDLLKAHLLTCPAGVVGKELSCSSQPECVYVAFLGGLTAWWLGPRANVPEQENGGSFRSHIASLPLYLKD